MPATSARNDVSTGSTGMRASRWARLLERDEILAQRAYWLKKDIKRPGKGKQQPATKQNSPTVTKILSLQEYCGYILNFKTNSNPTRTKRSWRMTVRIASSSRTSTSRSLNGPSLSRCSRNRAKSASAAPTKASIKCSPSCWSLLAVAAIFTLSGRYLEQVVLGEIRRLTKFASLYLTNF